MPVFLAQRALGWCLPALVLACTATAWPQVAPAGPGGAPAPQGTPEQAPRLRAPWGDRALDLGQHGEESIRVIADVPRTQAMELLGRVQFIRSLVESHFGFLQLRRPDAPRFLVFDDLAEMRFTLRTNFGSTAPETTALAVPHSNGMVLAVTTDTGSPLGLAQRLQGEAFRHFALPRFPESFPPWADFGLAEYYAAIPMSTFGWQSGLVPPRFAEALRSSDAEGRLIPLDRLIRLDKESWERFGRVQGFGLLHAEAWGLVQFLLHGGSEALADRFVRWLHQVAAGRAPVETFAERMAEGPDGVSIATLETAWRQWIRGLQPSELLAGLERVELLRAVLEQLEHDGVRPADPAELVSLARRRPELRHVVLSHPAPRALDSHDRNLLRPDAFEFIRAGGRDSEVDALNGPPPEVRLLDTGPWELSVVWDDAAEDRRWVPRVSMRRQR